MAGKVEGKVKVGVQLAGVTEKLNGVTDGVGES